jgi:hypothetical protein
MVYRSFQGKEVDIEKIMRQNELTQAVSNKKVNARGDELGPGGTIIKKREDVIAEYYEANPKVKAVPVARVAPSVQTTVEESTPAPTTKSKKTQTEE